MREPDALDSVRVLALALLVRAGVGALIQAGSGVPAEVAGILLEVGFLAVPLLYARVSGLAVFPSNGFARLPWKSAALVLVASMGSMWILKGLSDLQMDLLSRLGIPTGAEVEQIARRVDQARSQGGSFALAALVIAPALCEETLCRGLLFRGFARNFGAVRALIYTSLIFAALHLAIVQIVLMIFLGLFFGTVVRLTGSLWAGVLAHGVNNVGVLILTSFYGTRVELMRPPPLLLILSVAVFALALVLLALESRATDPRGTPEAPR